MNQRSFLGAVTNNLCIFDQFVPAPYAVADNQTADVVLLQQINCCRSCAALTGES